MTGAVSHPTPRKKLAGNLEKILENKVCRRGGVRCSMLVRVLLKTCEHVSEIDELQHFPALYPNLVKLPQITYLRNMLREHSQLGPRALD